MNLPFKLNLSKIAVAVEASNILPQFDGVKLVVMMVDTSSERLEII